jgi:hypothetical protein
MKLRGLRYVPKVRKIKLAECIREIEAAGFTRAPGRGTARFSHPSGWKGEIGAERIVTRQILLRRGYERKEVDISVLSQIDLGG